MLVDTQAGQPTSCALLLADQAGLSAAFTMRDADARGCCVYNTLRQYGERNQ